jgi:adenine-specific DNA-methyltransferase
MKAQPEFGLRRFRKIDKRGAYKEDDPTAPGGRRFELIHPHTKQVIPLRNNRGWGFDQMEFERLVSEDRIVFVTDTSIMVKRYLHETDSLTPPSVLYQPARSASERLAKLIGLNIFDFPKDETIISKFIEMCTSGGDIILDFFSGSGTTANAVIQLNAEDGGNRKFIMVQLPEQTDEKSEAYKAGFKNICEIGKERIRRAAKKIRDEKRAKAEKDGMFADYTDTQDYGFRVYRLDSSNMQDVYYHPQDYKQEMLDMFADNIKPDRTSDDLLAQVMLDWGLSLSHKIEQASVNGKQVFKVAEDSLYACFDNGIDETFAKEIAGGKPLRIVFRDSGFKDDTAKANVRQILKQLSPETDMKVI